MAILNTIKFIKMRFKTLSGYIKYALTSDSVIMENGKDLQTEINAINSNCTESGTYNGQKYEYTKFFNGEMILRQRLHIVVPNFHEWGNLWESDLLNFGKFVEPFISTPFISCQNIGNSGFFIENIYNTSSSNIGEGFVVRPNKVSNLSIFIDVIAIGRWK